MNTNKISLTTQIKKVIGNRILFCSVIFMLIIVGLTIYDLSISITQLKSRINEKIKPIEDFAIDQAMIDNLETVKLKIESFNEDNSAFRIKWIRRGEPIHKEISWRFPFSWVYDYRIDNIAGYQLGYFEVTGGFLSDKTSLYDLLIRIILLFIFTGSILIILFPLAKKIPQRLFVAPINNLIALLHNQKNTPDELIQSLPVEIEEIKNKIILLLKNVETKTRGAALGQMATQVAHDIRSPLTVLDIAITDLTVHIPEEQRILIRNATNRIYDIANNLLTQYKENKNFEFHHQQNKPELITDLVLNAISEKRTQYKQVPVEFSTYIHESAYGCFANVSAPEFKRVLSNLLNNSVDSFEGKINGIVRIKLSMQKRNMMISIHDNGCGIPDHILTKIVAGKTYTQKKNGHGLGLPYAIKLIEEEWNGQFSIQSCINEGTTVDIILPKSSAPTWFAQEIRASQHHKIVILDDDESIHQIWHKRFNKALPIQLFNFYRPKDLITWFHNNILKDVIFLIDYELIGSTMTGLDVIQQLNINKNAYLVTSRYEETAIRQNCEKLNIKIIPKNFSVYIPIKIFDKKISYDAILIDDDPMIHGIWNISAKKAGKKLNTYFTENEFMQDVKNIDPLTPIYIDVNLKSDIYGDIISKHIFANGFKELYLTTGHEKSRFADIPWIKGIIGKEPPWTT